MAMPRLASADTTVWVCDVEDVLCLSLSLFTGVDVLCDAFLGLAQVAHEHAEHPTVALLHLGLLVDLTTQHKHTHKQTSRVSAAAPSEGWKKLSGVEAGKG